MLRLISRFGLFARVGRFAACLSAVSLLPVWSVQAQALKSRVNFSTITPSVAVTNQLLVKYAGPVAALPPTGSRTGMVRPTALLGLHNLLGGKVEHQFRLIPWQLVTIPPNTSLATAARRYAESPDVLYVEPNYIIKALETRPDDPSYGQLWGMERINAPQAWDVSTGNTNIVVAVIDTGILRSHQDLQANMWVNPGEIAGNDIDDDGNSYTDDVHGWDFVNNDNDPTDDNGHGTHCAGTIGAVGNNGIGVAGVNWNVKLVAVKFLAGSGGGTTDGAIKSVEYVAAMAGKIHLSNNSWGGGGYSAALEAAIAQCAAANQLFLAAAGNDSADNDLGPHYPSNYEVDNVISVASIAEGGAISGFSNYGRTTVDIAAPGSAILSTWNTGVTSYNTISGTSMATPHVAGAAALLLGMAPEATFQDLRAALLGTARPNAALVNRCVTEGELDLGAAIGLFGSSLVLDRRAYRTDAVVTVTVADAKMPETATDVTVEWKTTIGTGAVQRAAGSLTVPRLAPDSYKFSSTLALDSGVTAVHGDMLTMEYLDAEGETLSVSVPIDDQPPVITNWTATGVTDESFTVLWETDEPAAGTTRADVTLPPSAYTDSSAAFTTNHAATFTGLEQLTRYFIAFEAVDPAGNVATWPTGPAIADPDAYFAVFTLKTEELYNVDFERGTAGWTTQTFTGERCWEFGVPGYGPVPSSRCWGTIIDGRYPASVNAVLVSPVFRVGTAPVITFNHWYDFYGYDHGMIEVKADGVWRNVTPYVTEETSIMGSSGDWLTTVLRLPAAFANRALQVRFHMFSDEYVTDQGKTAGWYIDTFRVTGMSAGEVVIAEITVDDAAPGGDGDGVAEAGEDVELTVVVVNVSDRNLTNVKGELTVLADGAAASEVVLNDGVVPALLNIGDLAQTEVVNAGPVRMQLAADINPDAKLVFSLLVTSDEGPRYEPRYTLSVEPRDAISGTVTDLANDSPINEAVVLVQRGSRISETRTGVDGTYAFGGLRPALDYAVTVHKPWVYNSQSRTVTAPAAGVDFALGYSEGLLTPSDLNMSVLQGEIATETLTLSNAGGSLPLNFSISTLPGPEKGVLRIEPMAGTLPAGASTNLTVTVNTEELLAPDSYVFFVSVDNGDAASGDAFATIQLDVLQKPEIDLIAVVPATDGTACLYRGIPGTVALTLTNSSSRSMGTLNGVVSPRDPSKAAIADGGAMTWTDIPVDSTSSASTPDITIDIDPANTYPGEPVVFDLTVTDPTGGGNDWHFEFTVPGYDSYAISGMVTCVNWPDSGVAPVDTNILSNVVVVAEDVFGEEIGQRTSDTNGLYSFQYLPATNIWMYVKPLPGKPAKYDEAKNGAWTNRVTPAGRRVVPGADTEENFEFRHDGLRAPYIRFDPLVVADDNANRVLERGEHLVLNAYVRNGGVNAAINATGLMVNPDTGYPDFIALQQGAASLPVIINSPTSPRLLQPVFEAQVDANAPKGAMQRYQLTVTGVNSVNGQTLQWWYDTRLSAASAISLHGTVSFSDGQNTSNNMQQVRLRLVMRGYDRLVSPASDGTYVFDQLPNGVTGTVEVVQTPAGYDFPPVPVQDVPALEDDQYGVDFEIPLWGVATVVPGPGGSLAFTINEGASTNGQFEIANNGATVQELTARVIYRRELGEVKAAPVALASEAPVATVDWAAVDADKVSPDEVVVRFAAGVSQAEQRGILAARGLEPVFFFNSFPAALARRVAGPASVETLAVLAAETESDPRVLLVAPDDRAEPKSLTLPDDRRFPEMFGLYNQRQTGGTRGADIRAPQAWNHTTGSREIVVAVCDTGVFLSHVDLKANIWENPTPGRCEGITGDLHGWNFGDWNNNVNDDSGSAGHGTHVAGTIGAVGNNSLGVAGVNWQVTIMPVRLVDMNGGFSSSARIAKAIEYAVTNGAHVSNHSWGGADTAGVMYDAIVFAKSNNHLVVAAAGNSSQNLDETRDYPAGYSVVLDNVITVAATDHDGELASFSCFGPKTVQIAAPGYDILSTYPDIKGGDEGNYRLMSGTSMACPHVAGVAALLWSLAPDAPYTVIRDAILKGARVDPNLEGWVSTSGHLDALGAIEALGARWLTLSTNSITLAAGETTNLELTVNLPPQLQARATNYCADVIVETADGRLRRQVPVSVKVNAGVWLEVSAVRTVPADLSADDGLAPSPGDTVDLWITLHNRGAATAATLQGVLSPVGNASTVISNTVGWGYVYGGETAEAPQALRVTLDPAAAGDLDFELVMTRAGQPAGTLPLTVPVLPGRKAAGRLLDAGGLPVAGARVECYGASGARAVSGTDGEFVLRGLPDGDYRRRVIPAAHARPAAEAAFSISGADAALGDIAVYAPGSEFSDEQVAVPVLLGGGATGVLSIVNNSPVAEGAFAFRVKIAPRRRVALVSDGTTLSSLVAPLEAMGFEVTHVTNNFRRYQRFWPAYLYYELQQEVRYTSDAAFLGRFDAVVADLSGPNGAGRLFSEAETAAVTAYLDRGGRMIITGGNPLSRPDNEWLAGLAGIDALDRQASPSAGQADASLRFESPFVTLENGDRLATVSQAYDLATPVHADATAVFRVGDASKLVHRQTARSGSLYIWTGNPDDLEWKGAGIWRDVLRGILWNELIEGSQVPWLTLDTAVGSVAAGDTLDIGYTLDSAYPVLTEAVSASVIILGNYAGADVRTVRFDMDVKPATLRVYTSGAVSDWQRNPLAGDGTDRSALFQVIWAGPDGVATNPALDGRPQGDDQLLSVFATGLTHGRFGVGEGVPADAGKFIETFRHRVPIGEANAQVFVRAWESATFDRSLAYGDSPLYMLDFVADESHDFGSWLVTNALRWTRDSNRDSVPDGWIIGNMADRDPRDAISALTPSGVFAGKLAVPDGRVQAEPRRVAVTDALIFVLDTVNNRVLTFDRASGALLRTTGRAGGEAGTAAGQFSQPYGMTLDPRPGVSRLIVADTFNDRLQIFGFDPLTGAVTNTAILGQRGTTDGRFEKPRGVGVMPGSGDIFVADTGNNRVQVFRDNGTFRWAFTGGALYVMNAPAGIAVDLDAGVIVADTGNNRLLRFTVQGIGQQEIGGPGSTGGLFQNPTDVHVWRHTRPDGTSASRLAVADRLNNRVQILSMNGTHLLSFGSGGIQDGEFNLPAGIFPVADSNRVYVADTANRRLQMFDLQLDADQDGMEDIWEERNGLDTTVDDAFDDADGDLLLNVGEYIVGTDPQDAGDNPFSGMVIVPVGELRITGLTPSVSAGGALQVSGSMRPFVLVWQAVEGRTYRIERSSGLPVAWEPAGTVTADRVQMSHVVYAQDGRGFFRVVEE
jgi:subtilisin family serine protease